MQHLTDEELVALCLEGDKEAFNLIVERYQKQAFSLAYRLGGDYDEARDMAQEAFIKVYSELSRFDCQRRFFPWFYRIAQNTCINFLNKKGKHLTSVEDIEAFSDTLAAENTPETVILKDETSDILRQALLELPEQFREPLILKYLQGYSYREIAQTLDLPESTIETRLYRGRQMLQKKLAPILGREAKR